MQEALAAYDEALNLAPWKSIVHQNRAHTLAWLGRCNEAAAALATVKEGIGSTADSRAHGSIAAVYFDSMFYKCPDHYYRDAMLRHARLFYEAFPERARTTYAEALFRNGDYAKARRLYTEAYEQDPEAGGWFKFAMTQWHLGNRVEARKLYEQTVAWA